MVHGIWYLKLYYYGAWYLVSERISDTSGCVSGDRISDTSGCVSGDRIFWYLVSGI